MGDVNLIDLVLSDTFRDIKEFLCLKDLFNLRGVCRELRTYIDRELSVLKHLNLVGQDERVVDAFELLANNCNKLETLNLNRCLWLDDEHVIKIIKRNSLSLRDVNLSNCRNLTAIALQPLIIECKTLKKLSLQNNNWLTIGCLETLAFHQSKNIEDLDLAYCCTVLSERCMSLMFNNFQKLRVLSLSSVSTVTDNILIIISKKQTQIEHLNLSNCRQITDHGIGAISLNCKKLESLSIRGCIFVTDRSLLLLRSKNVHIDMPRNGSNAFENRFGNFNMAHHFYLQV